MKKSKSESKSESKAKSKTGTQAKTIATPIAKSNIKSKASSEFKKNVLKSKTATQSRSKFKTKIEVESTAYIKVSKNHSPDLNSSFVPLFCSNIVTFSKSQKIKSCIVVLSHSQKNNVIKKYSHLIADSIEKTVFQKGEWTYFSFLSYPKSKSQAPISYSFLASPKPLVNTSHHGLLEESSYVFFKNQFAILYQKMLSRGVTEFSLDLDFIESDSLLPSPQSAYLALFSPSASPSSSPSRPTSLLSGSSSSAYSASSSCEGLFVGLELFCYNYLSLFKGSKAEVYPKIIISPKLKTSLGACIDRGALIGRSINTARHLVNIPPNLMTPDAFSKVAISLFKSSPNSNADVTLSVLNLEQIKKQKMGLIVGVGQGSPNEPKFIHIRYRPLGKHNKLKKTYALIGKGVTFDSGGLDIKPSSGMRLMKKDMAGASAVLGAMYYLSQSKCDLQVDAFIPLVENSVDGHSMRPSDVLISRSGQSVEIHNTDAEGRLVLADAIDYALTHSSAEKPDVIIDVATLTGAIKSTLGLEIGGIFSNDDQLSEELLKAGQASGDLLWRIPLYSKYTSGFSSPFADVVNAVDGWASPITAALFLERFVKSTRWAHLDIYGWQDKASGPLSQAGANGQAVSLLIKFLEAQSN